ncbi:hypothetical protein J6590_029443 [Homalodisca vitripennis]|nr:hypothetical protein J6590_029443 [Homalodisca vitripennis]
MDSETRPMGRISQFHPNSRKSTEFLGGQRGMLSGGSRGIVTAALVRHLTPPRACLGVFKVAERDGSTDRVIKGRGSSRDSSHRSRPACPPIVEWLTETLDKAGSTRARPTGMDLGAFVLVLVAMDVYFAKENAVRFASRNVTQVFPCASRNVTHVCVFHMLSKRKTEVNVNENTIGEVKQARRKELTKLLPKEDNVRKDRDNTRADRLINVDIPQARQNELGKLRPKKDNVRKDRDNTRADRLNNVDIPQARQNELGKLRPKKDNVRKDRDNTRADRLNNVDIPQARQNELGKLRPKKDNVRKDRDNTRAARLINVDIPQARQNELGKLRPKKDNVRKDRDNTRAARLINVDIPQARQNEMGKLRPKKTTFAKIETIQEQIV